jgi:hypothetical protein
MGEARDAGNLGGVPGGVRSEVEGRKELPPTISSKKIDGERSKKNINLVTRMIT